MRLPEQYLRTIVAHAQEGRPNEVCGLIAGRDGRATKLYRTTNSDPNPRVRYNVEPLELLHVLREMERVGWGLMAIYHSHPATDAYPSATDIGLAYYPDSVYIIVSLVDPAEPVVKAFKIVNGQVVEEPLEIEEGEPPGDLLKGREASGGSAARRLSRVAISAKTLVAATLRKQRASRDRA